MKNWTVSKMISAAFGSLGLFMAVILVIALIRIYQSRNVVRAVDEAYLPVSELAVQMERNLLTARVHFVYLATLQKEGSGQEGLKKLAAAEENCRALRQTVASDERLAELLAAVDALQGKLANYQSIALEVVRIQQSGRWSQELQSSYLARWTPLGNEITQIIGDIGRRTVAQSRLATRQSAASLNNLARVMLGITLLALLFGILTGARVSRSIIRRLRKVAEALQRGSSQLSSAADQLKEASQNLSNDSTEQAAALQETSASAEQVSSMARRNLESAHSAAALSQKSGQRFQEASSALENLVSAMNNITDQAQRVNKIVKTIDEIAFQTSILALNAAVEAARAGDAGFGFSVVADEVRGLALRSSQAAKDTAALVTETIARSNEGKQKTDVMVQLFAAIAEESKQMKELIEQVNLGSQEQSRGLEQVAKAIQQIEVVTQHTAAAAQESASASRELAAQSMSLDNTVHELENLVGR